MNTDRKEGAVRPLCFRVPILNGSPAARWAWAALASYVLAYLYVREILFPSGVFANAALPVFAALFLAGVEWLARAAHRTPAREAPLWAVCWAALSIAMPLLGYQEELSLWQPAAWHLFAVWYVLARCNVLAQGFSGSLCFLDAVAGLLRLPFGHFFARVKTLWHAVRGGTARRVGLRRTVGILGTLVLAAVLCVAAWSLLAAADSNFARLGTGVSRWINSLLNREKLVNFAVYFALSLPVGAWLYGLVFGALHRDAAPCTAEQFAAKAAPLRVLPAVSANVIVGALCAVYALFFALQAAEWLAAAPLGLSAPRAADFAVDGFWELLKILLLNFSVLAAVRFLGRAPAAKGLGALFCGFGLAFAGLSAAKLAVYVDLYGFTPRRVVAGWFLAVLAVWAVLLLVRVFRPLPAARIGLAVLVVSFTLLSCIDLNSRIVYANIDRYAAGQDKELDVEVLRSCGFGGVPVGVPRASGSGIDHTAAYTERLLAAGWFIGQSRDTIASLYSDGYGVSGGASDPQRVQVSLDSDRRLVLTYDRDTCIAAEIVRS